MSVYFGRALLLVLLLCPASHQQQAGAQTGGDINFFGTQISYRL